MPGTVLTDEQVPKMKETNLNDFNSVWCSTIGACTKLLLNKGGRTEFHRGEAQS